MTRPHDTPQSPSTNRVGGRQSYQTMLEVGGQKRILQQRVSNRMALAGMALGYLGLVAVLAMAPIWGQSVLGYDESVAACTESGGSR